MLQSSHCIHQKVFFFFFFWRFLISYVIISFMKVLTLISRSRFGLNGIALDLIIISKITVRNTRKEIHFIEKRKKYLLLFRCSSILHFWEVRIIDMRHHDTPYRCRDRCHRWRLFEFLLRKQIILRYKELFFLEYDFFFRRKSSTGSEKNRHFHRAKTHIRKLKHGGNTRLRCGNTAATFCFR